MAASQALPASAACGGHTTVQPAGRSQCGGRRLYWRNDQQQYSLWPAHCDLPAGWTVVCPPQSAEACNAWLAANWSTLTPAHHAAVLLLIIAQNVKLPLRIVEGVTELHIKLLS